MPRKKNKKKENIKKQITSRLMQISLKVDDYIYKNKPMLEREADTLLKEVAAYTDSCCGDARSLQVIEKLIRCLKVIIEEQQELQKENDTEINVCTLVNLETIPVNFQPKTQKSEAQLAQDVDLDNILHSITEKIKLSNHCHTNKDAKINSNKQNILCPSDEEVELDKPKSNKNNATSNNAQETVANLSIYDNAEPLLIETNDIEVNSQSILDNFELVPFNDVLTTKIRNFTFSQDLVHNASGIGETKNNIRDINIPLKSEINISDTNLKISNAQTKVKQGKRVSKKVENCCLDKPQRKTRAYTRKIDKEKNKKFKPAHIKKNKQKDNEIAEDDRLKMTDTNNSLRNNGHALNKISNHPRHKQTKNNNLEYGTTKNIQESIKKPSSLTQQETTNENNTNKSYNKAIEMDLSWVENIKYVREVAKEEFFPALFGDDFWENFTLPNDWNNNDFLYAT